MDIIPCKKTKIGFVIKNIYEGASQTSRMVAHQHSTVATNTNAGLR